MKTTDRLLLDTDIVIHLLKKQPNTVRWFLELKEQTVEFLLSPIVVAEVYAGAFEREFDQIEIFFRFLPTADSRSGYGSPGGTICK